jgi:glycosyltransferase involved in cell wall biosynthesis
MPMLNLVIGGMGGTETYTQELLAALALRDDVSVRTYVPRSAKGYTPASGETVVQSISNGPSVGRRLSALAKAASSRALRSEVGSADVAHFPFTVPLPRPGNIPSAVTLHDVQHLDMPHFFGRAERAYRRFAYDRAARHADMVITVSDYCRRRIGERLGVPDSRIRVVPLGVADDFRQERAPARQFVLYPARRWPHKNHGRLLQAMSSLREERPDLRLVLTGGGEPLPNPPGWVEQRGLVSRRELADLYRSAACMAFPSLYEGFGLPLLEAMASGCPVATSTAGSLREVAGGAAVAFDPEDVAAMASAIGRAIDAGDRLRDAGLVRAGQFTWDACAQAHMEAYNTLVTA